MNWKQAILMTAPSLLGACHGAYVTRGQGWTMHQPTLRLIFQGDRWSDAEIETYRTHWDTLMNDPGHVLDRLAEYGVVKGTFDTTIYKTQLSIGDAISTGQVPAPVEDTIYAVMLLDQDKLSYGRHDAATYQGVPYAYLTLLLTPYRPQNDGVLSHEIYEAATDPTEQGYRDYGTGQEVGDICEWGHDMIDGVFVQQVWSQSAKSCR